MGGKVISSGSGRRGPWSHTRAQTMSGAALAVLVVLASIFLLQAGGAQATPNVFSFDRLRLGGSAGPENYVYTVGNVIFPDAGVDPGTYYRFVVTDSSGGVRNPSFPCTAAAGFPIADNTYTVGQSDPPSAGSGWRYTLNQYGNPSCSGAPTKSTFKNLYIAKATAYADAGLTTEKSSFTAGETAYVAIQGVSPGANDWSVTWLRPLSAAVCANTAGPDRPQGSGSGRLPKGTTNYLQYRPNTVNTGNAWNRESNYETRPCVALGSTNEGVWGLSVDLNATNFVSVSAFTVDATAPPSPTIDSGPSGATSSTSASFGFSDSESGVSFRCQLDGGGFSDCSSPQGYGGLSQGAHSFQVKARDAAGNESAAASRSWTVDTLAPPSPTIDSAPSDPSNSTSASFGFSDSESGVSFRCQLDGAGFSDCSSPQGYSGLSQGSHSFQVKARDAAGNESVAASRSWTIDSNAPAVTLTAPANGSATANPTPTFSGAAGALLTDSMTVTVKIYSGSTPTGTPVQTLTTTRTGSSWSAAASPALAEGIYTAQAEQGDFAGNTGQSSANTLTVDLTAPAISLTSPAQGSSTTEPRPTFSGAAGTAPRDSSSITVRVYSGSLPSGTPLQILTTTAQGGGAYSIIASSALQAGTYTARAEQNDSVGNTGLSSANTFSITAPVLLAAGDIASCEAGDGDTATAALVNQNPEATVVTLGDHVYSNGTASEFANCYNPTWGQFKSRTRPAVGDHEYGTPNAAGYYNYFANQLAPYGPSATDPTRGYYSYDIGAWHVAALNSTCYVASIGCNRNVMEQWFVDDLNAHPTACSLAIVHEPRYSSGNVHGNNAQMQALWQIAYEHGVDLILSASEHDYERFAPMDAVGNADPVNGMREIVVGTGGYFRYGLGTLQPNSQVWNGDTFGVLKLTLSAGSYGWEFVPVAGETFTDSGSTACHAAPPPPPAQVPSVRAQSTGTSNGPATTLTLPKPAGTVSGDLLLAFAANMNGQNRNMAAPAGWTAVPNTEVFNGTGVRTHAWYRFAGPSEPSSFGFTMTGGSGYDMSGGIAAITGVATAGPINASAAQQNGAASTFITAPSVTTTVANTLLLFGGACNVAITYTPPVGMIERWDIASSGSFKVATELATQALPTAGATGTRRATASGNCSSAGVDIALAPAG